MADWRALVEKLQLQPHPEGGFFRETYRAAGTIRADSLAGHQGVCNYSTAIYYFLPPGGVSKLHRLKSDEVFHFYLGGPMRLVKLGPAGEVETVLLGQDVVGGQAVQHVVPAGWWFGACCEDGSPFSLVGCTVAPGFDFADFEFADRNDLLKRYPTARKWIDQLMPEEKK